MNDTAAPVVRKPKPAATSGRFGIIAGGIKLMTRRERLGAFGIVALMMLAGLLESAVVALVVPLVYVVVDPARFNATAIGRATIDFLGHPIDQMFLVLASGLAVLLLVSAATSGIAQYMSEVHSVHCRDRVSRDLIGRLINAPYIWIIKNSSMVMVRHIFEDVRAWRRDFIQAMLMSVQAAIMIIAPAAVVVALAPARGIAALVVVGLVCGAIVFAFRRKIRTTAARTLAVQDVFLKTLLQIITGIREVKVSGNAGFFIAHIERYHRSLNRLVVLGRMWSTAPATIISLLGQLGFIATAAVLWSRGSSGAEFAAQIALIAVVVSRVVPAFNRLSSQVSTIFRAAPMVESLLAFSADIDRAQAESGRAAVGNPVPAEWRRLALNDVWFRYPGAERWSLKGATVELERGKAYGFVGRSGAGKTTLVNLLLGLLEPTRGEIRIDGQSLSELTLSDWHRRFGYVPQDAFLFDTSLRDNILFGASEADQGRLRAVIEAAQLAEVVDAQGGGLDSRVGERGRELSGGQAQRVAIARALYRKPEILFLDEATSALDSMTETAIYDAIDALRGECLALIVAHRVTSLRRCDRIFVLDGGSIVEAGTYRELLERSDIFRALAAQSEDEPAPAPA